MPSDCVDYQSSGYFSKLIIDYLDQNDTLKSLYNHFPNIESFELQMHEKSINFDARKRQILCDAIHDQHKNFKISDATQDNISSLQNINTFTVTTGHQLNLFTGPIYFIYKIVTTINLAKTLKAAYPTFNFVPIYWMATEDHDFEEINYFNFKGKKIKWMRDSNGPVGRLSTDGLAQVFDVFSKDLDVGDDADFLKNLFQNAYLKHKNLADATRFIVNELFGKNGLVIIDGDDKSLKNEFVPILKDELLNRKSFERVMETAEKLKSYKIQVNPREINLFFIENNLRERIVFEDQKYKINNTNLEFSETEIIQMVADYPEKFSPNVVLRPLYQETILPNLCYIGGGGELAYWLELKTVFEFHKTTFPILMLRNSALIASKKQISKMNSLGINWNQLFLKKQDLLTSKTKQLSEFEIDFSEQKKFLKLQFENLLVLAAKTDKSFLGAVLAQQKKQLNGLDTLEKRLLKAQKRKFLDALEHISNLQNELFPNNGLQERICNFAEFYNATFIDKVYEALDPFSQNFTIIESN